MSERALIWPLSSIVAYWSYRRRLKTHGGRLLNNVRTLANYAMDNKRNLDAVVEAHTVFHEFEGKTNFTTEETKVLASLEMRLLPDENEVTVDTLRATGSGSGHGSFFSSVGFYLGLLWLVTFALVLITLRVDYEINLCTPIGPGELPADRDCETIVELIRYYNNSVAPFIYGTLGALAYLMRISGRRLSDRTFDPDRIPEHINRLVLGTLSGGMIIILVRETEGFVGEVTIGVAALGFIAGYSIDFLFQTADRVIAAVLPRFKPSEAAERADSQQLKLARKRTQARLDEVDNALEADPNNLELQKERAVLEETLHRLGT